MPGLEEVFAYMRGLWLSLANPQDGLRHLDMTWRGFKRSFWAILYCVPPMLLAWADFRLRWLTTQPKGTSTGPDFFAKLAVIELSAWLFSVIGIVLILAAAGRIRSAVPVIVVNNWLMVAASWLMVVPSALSMLAGDGGLSGYFLWLVLVFGFVAIRGMLFAAILGPDRALVGALVLADFVLSIYASGKLLTFVGLG